jgi:hypothetical protein
MAKHTVKISGDELNELPNGLVAALKALVLMHTREGMDHLDIEVELEDVARTFRFTVKEI